MDVPELLADIGKGASDFVVGMWQAFREPPIPAEVACARRPDGQWVAWLPFDPPELSYYRPEDGGFELRVCGHGWLPLYEVAYQRPEDEARTPIAGCTMFEIYPVDSKQVMVSKYLHLVWSEPASEEVEREAAQPGIEEIDHRTGRFDRPKVVTLA